MNERKGKELLIASVTKSFIDVPGRVSANVYFAGCNRPCKEYCHNKQLHDENLACLGANISLAIIKECIDQGLINAVCLTGGEPLYQDLDKLKIFINDIKTLKDDIYLCLYTSYNIHDIPENILNLFDVVKSGMYDPREEQEEGSKLASSNQKFTYKEDYK